MLKYVMPMAFIVLLLGEITLRLSDQNRQMEEAEKRGLVAVYGSPDRFAEIIKAYKAYELTYEPYLRWRGKPNQKHGILTTNAFGLREGDFSIQKPIGLKRIIITGNSVAWGFGTTSVENTLAKQLEKNLKNTQVLNFAEIGYVASQEAILWNTIERLDPDAVIHFTGYNDALVALNGRPIRLQYRAVPENILASDKISLVPAIIRFYLGDILRNIKLISVIKSIFPQQTQRPPNENSLSAFSDFTDSMRIIALRARDKKIPLVIILQPTLFTTKKPLSRGEKELVAYYTKQNPKTTEVFTGRFSEYRSMLIDFAKTYGFKFIDSNEFFSENSQQLFLDSAHLTDAGHTLTAQEILPYIKLFFPKQ